MANERFNPVTVSHDNTLEEGDVNFGEEGIKGQIEVVLPNFLQRLERAQKSRKLPDEIKVKVEGGDMVIEVGTVTPPVTLRIPTNRDDFEIAVQTWRAAVEGQAFFDLDVNIDMTAI